MGHPWAFRPRFIQGSFQVHTEFILGLNLVSGSERDRLGCPIDCVPLTSSSFSLFFFFNLASKRCLSFSSVAPALVPRNVASLRNPRRETTWKAPNNRPTSLTPFPRSSTSVPPALMPRNVASPRPPRRKRTWTAPENRATLLQQPRNLQQPRARPPASLRPSSRETMPPYGPRAEK